MHIHPSSVLEGPISADRPWWPRAPWPAVPAADSAPPPRPTDPGVRTELVERIRREIEAGTYETPQKWQIALDRLLDDLERADET